MRFRRAERFHFKYFWGQHTHVGGPVTASCLSQWFPVAFVVEGVRYATAEHWMMAERARLFGDTEVLDQVWGIGLTADAPEAQDPLRGASSCWDWH